MIKMILTEVYFGDILWKSLGLPVINYACSSWTPSSTSDTKRLEHLQVSMARSILKAPRNMTKEALYAELGWSPLTSVQDRFRIDFFDRLLSMNNDRWPKLLFNVTYHVFREHSNIKWKWYDYMENCFSNCGLEHLFSNNPQRNKSWVCMYRNIRKHLDNWDWIQKAQSKSSLSLYLSLKDGLNKERYLLDSTNFQGVSLKLRARTNTLQLERYIRSWSQENDGRCKLCDINEDETIDHFLFMCSALQSIRVTWYKKLEDDLQEHGLVYGRCSWHMVQLLNYI